MKEAYLYKKLKDKKLVCNLCSHNCIIENGGKGKCYVRENRDGKLYSLVYRKLISENVDPIEKKPLFHFLPGSQSLSIATVGCNFKCFYCQNYEISQMPSDYNKIEGRDVPSEKLVRDALRYDCKSISYTYTEPTIFFEYAYDAAKLAHDRGIKNVFVTNGFMTSSCIKMIEPYLDAANIDLKSFSEEFYKKVGGRLKPVLDSIKLMKKLGIWVEVSTLIIPGINNSSEELKKIAEFLNEIDSSIPWHISAYYPQYKSKIKAATIDDIENAINIGRDTGLRYVYGGNVPTSRNQNTYCHNCDNVLIERPGYTTTINKINKGKCPYCGRKIDGVFE